MQQLLGQGHVWFLFGHFFAPEKQHFLDYLNQHGQRLDMQLKPQATLYLYDLS